jgi:hypothetical protein
LLRSPPSNGHRRRPCPHLRRRCAK